MPQPSDNRIGKVSSQTDYEKDQQFAKKMNLFVILLAAITTIVLFFW